MCDLGILVGKYPGGGRGAFESGEDFEEFEEVEGHMFGFTRNGHYRLILDRRTCKSLQILPISFGHPAATDKDLSYVLRFVADAPVLITELEKVPRMDITLNKLFFSPKSSINANIMGTSRYRGQQGHKIIIYDDKEGKRIYYEPLFRIFQINYVGNSGVVFVYLAVNHSLMERLHIKDFSVSFQVEAQCRGMSCRTADGLLQHETIAKGKKFEAAWRKYSASYDKSKSCLLMVLVQSGATTEMGRVVVDKVTTRYGAQSRGNTLNTYLGISPSADHCDYDAYGIFNSVDIANSSALFQNDPVSRGENVIIGMNGTDYNSFDYINSNNEVAELQKAIDMSSNMQQERHCFNQDLEAAIAASLATSTIHTSGKHYHDMDSSYSRDLELAIKLSARKNNDHTNTTDDLIDSPVEKNKIFEVLSDDDSDTKPSLTEKQSSVTVHSDFSIEEKRRLAAEAALKRFK